jgi:hypothetical protein
MENRRLSVMGSTMIVNRLDYAGDDQGGYGGAGVGISLLERGQHEAGKISARVRFTRAEIEPPRSNLRPLSSGIFQQRTTRSG